MLQLIHAIEEYGGERGILHQMPQNLEPARSRRMWSRSMARIRRGWRTLVARLRVDVHRQLTLIEAGQARRRSNSPRVVREPQLLTAPTGAR